MQQGISDCQALHLRFKGARNYLHGSDIYNAVNDVASLLVRRVDAYLSNLVFRKFVRKDCNVCLLPPENERTIVGTGRIRSGNEEPRKIWIAETERMVFERYEFIESEITSAAIDGKNRIRLEIKTGYTPIEEVIALTKSLSYRLVPDISGKWLFAQLDLTHPFKKERKNLAIVQKSVLAKRFSDNEIFQDDEYAGNIRFIVGEP